MKTIRGLQRGIQVIRALQEAPGLSLAELHRATDLPKATLLRVMQTLENERLVWRSLGDGLYRYRAAAFSPVWMRNQQLAQHAGPLLAQLQRETQWPSDLVVYRRYFMELVETSRGLSRLAISRDTFGERVDIPGTAAGRAFLAFCDERDRRRIVDHLVRHPALRGPLGAVDERELAAALDQVRRDGYARRDPRLITRLAHLGRTDDGLDAIAVPVRRGARVIGAVNLVWLRRFALADRLIARYLGRMQELAARIGEYPRRRSAG